MGSDLQKTKTENNKGPLSNDSRGVGSKHFCMWISKQFSTVNTNKTRFLSPQIINLYCENCWNCGTSSHKRRNLKVLDCNWIKQFKLWLNQKNGIMLKLTICSKGQNWSLWLWIRETLQNQKEFFTITLSLFEDSFLFRFFFLLFYP